MSGLVIAVGSTRKPKLAAVREAVGAMAGTLAPDIAIEILGVEVESGVNHTPLSREESMRGARQRAVSLQKVAGMDAILRLTVQADGNGRRWPLQEEADS